MLIPTNEPEVKSWIQTQQPSRPYCSGENPGFIDPDSVLVKIDSKGRIVLPSSIRKSLGLESGEELVLQYDMQNANFLRLLRGKEGD